MEKKKCIQSAGPPIDALDDDINGPRLAPYRYVRSRAAKADVASDDSLPLFLSGQSDRPEQQGLEQASENHRKKATVSPRVVRTCILTAPVVAAVFALLSIEDRRAVIVTATASLAGGLPGLSELPSLSELPGLSELPRLSELPDLSNAVGRSSAATAQTAGGVRAIANGGEAVTPTREEIAAAFQTAVQGQGEIRQAPAAAPPPRRLDPDELATLLKRAKDLIAMGDIASARLFLERAADAHEAGAALILAQTYDPAVLGTSDARSITPDPAAARAWYQKAAQFGSQDAQRRLDQMQN
jgi:hypothetical protein